MKILFTGGGTGGHFYPIIAVAEKINLIAEKEKLLEVKLFYMSNRPYDQEALYEEDIKFIYTPAGRLNFFGFFKIIFGSLTALIKMFFIYPDVVFAKGGYGSFPALLAARILRIPVVVHESDSVPGRVNRWAGKFAKRVALSFEAASQYFSPEKIAWTGQPIRSSLQTVARGGVFEYLKLNPKIPVITILGGSQGAQKINDILLEALPTLLNHYQIIHQVGAANLEEINTITSVSLKDHPNRDWYKPFAFLNLLALRMAAGASSLIISRGGSVIFEIAAWGLPSIIIPLPSSHADHQKINAYNYARVGAAVVLEEANLAPHLLISEIDRLFGSKEKMEQLKKGALAFSKLDAALKIAEEIVSIALRHKQ